MSVRKVASLIRSISVETLDIPLLQPFGIARGVHQVASNLLVTIELHDGTLGFGEAAPFAAFNGETQEATRTAILAMRHVIEDADVYRWRSIADALRSELGAGYGAARCAIETAIIDALTRQAHLPLWAFFGGAATRVATDMTIPTGSAANAIDDARRIAAMGIDVIKVKVGGTALQEDVERVAAICKIAPHAKLILDGNASMTSEAAVELIKEVKQLGAAVVLMEQPVAHDDWEGLKDVTRRAGVDVAADESLTSVGDALRIIKESAATVFNIKLMKCGIAEAFDIAALARATGMRLMIGGMIESILAMTTSACFAAGLGGFSFVDLDTPLFLASNPFDGGYVQQGSTLHLDGIQAGHGVTPHARMSNRI